MFWRRDSQNGMDQTGEDASGRWRREKRIRRLRLVAAPLPTPRIPKPDTRLDCPRGHPQENWACTQGLAAGQEKEWAVEAEVGGELPRAAGHVKPMSF